MFQAINEVKEKCCQHVVHKKFSSTTECCGKAIYDYRDQSCVNHKVKNFKAEGCGRHDTNTRMCCGKTLYHRVPGLTACCDDLAYDSEKDVCCQERDELTGKVETKLAIRPEGSDSVGCCGMQAYNSESHICCFGLTNKRGKGNTDCCGTDVMDVNTEVCCRGKPQPLIANHTGCCGEEPYDTDSYVCCNDAILPKLTGEEDVASCCGSMIMDAKYKICCQGVIQPKDGLNWVCCGSKSYDINAGICCGGSTYVRGSKKACCGAGAVDLSDGECCDKDIKRFGCPKSANLT